MMHFGNESPTCKSTGRIGREVHEEGTGIFLRLCDVSSETSLSARGPDTSGEIDQCGGNTFEQSDRSEGNDVSGQALEWTTQEYTTRQLQP